MAQGRSKSTTDAEITDRLKSGLTSLDHDLIKKANRESVRWDNDGLDDFRTQFDTLTIVEGRELIKRLKEESTRLSQVQNLIGTALNRIDVQLYGEGHKSYRGPFDED